MPITSSPSPWRPNATANLWRARDLVGRFELREPLGQGGQSSVWRAFDPRMERDVAIKIMRLDGASDERAVAQWLQEARSAGRVQHPNIVPVFEADIHDRHPYLVFEYVAGKTLDRVLRERGALPVREAVALMLELLDAVAVAHAAGVVHRDLKPSNVLIDTGGHARVMDFGIAARVRSSTPTPADANTSGTIGYMAPEAADGAPPSEAMDVFSAGLVLAEMLLGRPLLNDSDPHRVLYRLAHEDLVLPAVAPAGVDDALRAIVQRAMARNPVQRHANARAFFAALQSWQQALQAPPTGAGAAPGAASGTLEFLLRRMRHKSDFPALSDAVVRIQSLATSETESVQSITNAILKDVALTNKLLRLVNSAHYARGGSVSTVSRAVSLVGLNGIRNMALSLVLLEHMQDKTHAAQLKEEFLRSLMAGSIGSELCTNAKDNEEAFVGAMFQNMGRLLAQYYFPEEAQQVRALVQSTRDSVSESVASTRVLGLSYEALGLGIAKAWGLPPGLQRCMHVPATTAPTTAVVDTQERIRWTAVAANAVADVLLHTEPAHADGQLAALGKRFGPALGLRADDFGKATAKAREKLIEQARAMEIHVQPGTSAARLLLQPTPTADAAPAAPAGEGADAALVATVVISAETTSSAKLVTETLAAGIQDITNAMVEDFKLADVLRMILETMYRALGFDRVIFCMRDARTQALTGRFGLGNDVEACVRAFQINLKSTPPDLFAAVCVKGLDTMISDSSDARLVQRLPTWYRNHVHAASFLLLPLQIKGAPFGLIYADKLQPGALSLEERELAMLRTLRNQAVMAFKQSA